MDSSKPSEPICDPGPAHCSAPCRDRVLAWARRELARRDDAEDLCQEVCVRCLDGASFGGECEFRTWLYRLKQNALADSLRERSRRPDPAETVADSAGEAGGTGRAPEDVAVREPGVRAALEQLTSEQREILWLADAEQWSAAEIAAQREISVQAVRQALSRARRAFRQAWARGGGGEESP